MPNNDVLYKDQNVTPLSFNPRTKDIGGGGRESIIGVADTTDAQIDPMAKTGGSVTTFNIDTIEHPASEPEPPKPNGPL